MAGQRLRIGVDTGGTFTDVCIFDADSGRIDVWKLSSSNADPSQAIAEGARQSLQRNGFSAAQVGYFGHGTTVATNALIQGRTARTAMITTAGFRDVVEIGRQTRPALYDLQTRRAQPLAPRDLRLEVSERVGADGQVLLPLDEAQVLQAIERLREARVEAVAVCLLFAHLAPAHERRIKALLAEHLPEVFVSTSHEVAAEYREFERFSTTLINAALGPVMTRYLQRLVGRLDELGIDSPPRLTQSNGGVIAAEHAARHPVRTVLSGPAAGVMGAIEIARGAGLHDLITFDMGGTSSDVCLISGGRAPLAMNARVHGHPLKVPLLNIHAVGAGGGSIARVDAGGLLKVGPDSAGALPGPVCYGNGNDQPTVTDANVVLQILNPTHLLGGRMPIDRERSLAAIARQAEQLGLDVMQTAQGILAVVTANMAKAIRVVSIEQGHDPRDYALMAFGGAGPLHAARLARELDMQRILVPPSPGILCAMGLLLTDPKAYFSAGCQLTLDAAHGSASAALFEQLAGDARQWFASEGIAAPAQRLQRFADLRYAGQAHELLIACPDGELDAAWLAEVQARFSAEHRQIYGFDSPDEPVRIVALRVEATAQVERPALRAVVADGAELHSARSGEREVWLAETGGFSTLPVYDRARLQPGHCLHGPAIVEQMDSTTLVLPGQHARVDAYLNLLIEETRA
ncbi:MAG: Acetophenone carboxylase gamma subunit [Stenotrophomonas maltophilia]|nr:MAG: Acetophenone carboxylase gamma subunit [Stenotrophomonas maltophilia]